MSKYLIPSAAALQSQQQPSFLGRRRSVKIHVYTLGGDPGNITQMCLSQKELLTVVLQSG